MAYTRDLFPKFNFVYPLATGTVDDQTLMIHLMSFHAETTAYPFFRELVDARDLHNVAGLSVQGLIRAAETHQRLYPDKDLRGAVLVDSTERRKGVDIYASLAKRENLHVKAFGGEFDEPLAWLGFDPPERVEIQRFIEQCRENRPPRRQLRAG